MISVRYKERDARRQMAKIEDYWLRRGFDVQLRLERPERGDEDEYGEFYIRSDMVNGMPRRRLVA